MFAEDAYDGWADDLARLVRGPEAAPAGLIDRLRCIRPGGRDVPALLASLAHLPARCSPAADDALALVLDLLDQARCTPDQPNRGDLDWGALVRLAEWLPEGSRLWPTCMGQIVRVTLAIGEVNERRTREPIARWRELFLEPAPLRTRSDYQAAADLLCRVPVTDADVLFPRLLFTLDDPRRRACVLRIATSCTVRDGNARAYPGHPALLPEHPLAGRVDLLARLIAEAAEPGATPEAIADALAACGTLFSLPGGEAEAVLVATLSHPVLVIRLDVAAVLAGRGDERGRRTLEAALADPRTRRAARAYIPDEESEDHLGVKFRSDRARVSDCLGEAALSRRIAALGARLVRWMEHGVGAPPLGVEVVALQGVRWPGDLVPDFICAVRHPFPCGPGDETALLTVVGTAHGWHPCEESDVSVISVLQEEVVSEMYRRDLWTVEKVRARRSPYEQLFTDWPAEPLEDVSVLAVADVQPLDDQPVVVATARWRGEAGWAVAHGWETRWYPTTADDEPGYAVGALGRYVALDLLGLASHQVA